MKDNQEKNDNQNNVSGTPDMNRNISNEDNFDKKTTWLLFVDEEWIYFSHIHFTLHINYLNNYIICYFPSRVDTNKKVWYSNSKQANNTAWWIMPVILKTTTILPMMMT